MASMLDIRWSHRCLLPTVESMKIAFLGLGSMGAPMAHRLHEAGHELTVWNRSPKDFPAATAATPADAVREAEVVITMLADPTAVREVVTSFADALKPGTYVVDASTIGPDAAREVAALLPDGVTFIDAPVMGSTDRAGKGELLLLVGGDADPVVPVLEVLGTVRRTGPQGTGAALKIVLINAVISGVAVVAEAMARADEYGLSEELVKGALTASPLGALAGRAFATGVHFSVRLAAKDVALAKTGVVTKAVHELLTSYPDINDEDVSAIVGAVRRQS
jgi:3-hydroxyisobutyrate dehydrogenase-like beta-hydroxyacid dehydrogenase